MKHIVLKSLALTAAPVGSLGSTASQAQVAPRTIDTRIGKLESELGLPTEESVARLFDES